MAILKRYSYGVELSYVESSTKKEINIQKETIEYIMVSYDYENNIIPIIVTKIRLSTDIYNKMFKDQGKGKLSLYMYRNLEDATSTSNLAYIDELFDYYMSNNTDPSCVLNVVSETNNMSYITCIIGLCKTELINQNIKEFGGVYSNIDLPTLVHEAVSSINIVMEPISNASKIQQISIPKINTIYRYLEYVNSKYSLYNSQYMYFMDFKYTYMKSMSGKYLDAKDGQHSYVAIDIRDLSSHKSITNGIVIDDKQDAYIVYVNASVAIIHSDNISPQVSGSITVVGTNGSNTVKIDTESIVNTVSNDSNVVVRSEDLSKADMIKNTIENNTISISFNKIEVDASIFTPNKEYLVSNYSGNDKYTGRYRLSFKQELFQNTGIKFVCASNIGITMVEHY